MKITRRQAGYLIAAGAIASGAVIGRLLNAQTSPTVVQAVQLIQQSGDRLVAILDSTSDWPTKRRQVLALIAEAVDVAGIARFSLGRFWNAASEEQRAECVRLFPEVLIGGLGRSIGAYQNLRFVLSRGAEANDTVRVWTRVLRQGDPPREVIWVVGLAGSAPKIVDIMAEGASLRITERDDCVSFMTRNNYSMSALIDELRRQAQATV